MIDECELCGDPIKGQKVTVPQEGAEAETYHRGCVDVQYPDDMPVGPWDIMSVMELPEDAELTTLFDHLAENPGEIHPDKLPEAVMEIEAPLKPRDYITFMEYLRNDEMTFWAEKDIATQLTLAVLFGAALERYYPAASRNDPAWEPEDVREEGDDNG